MAALPNPPSDGSRHRSGPELPEERVDQALAALGDPDCRELLEELGAGPRTASELAADCGLPSTTCYRKLGMLVDGGLVTEETEIATDGRNATRYHLRVEDLAVHIDDREGVELETALPPAEGSPRRND